MLSNKEQLQIRNHLVESQKFKDNAMLSLNKGDLQKASLMFNLDARVSDKLSALLKNIEDAKDAKN